RDPVEHPLVRALLPKYLADLAEAEQEASKLDAQIKAVNSDPVGSEDEAGGEEDTEEGAEDSAVVSEAELKKLRKQRTEARKTVRALREDLIAALKMERQGMAHERERAYVLEFAERELVNELQEHSDQQRRVVVAELENWWDKYQTSLEQVEARQEKSEAKLNDFLKGLGYV